MNGRAITAFAVLLVLGIVVAGCGGGGSTDTDTGLSATLTKPEFTSEADAICKAGNESAAREAEEFAEENNIDTKKATSAQQEEVVRQVVAPNIREQGEEISELPAPSGDEEKVQAILSAIESGAEEAEESPKLLVENKGGGPFAQADKLAREYGMKTCGSE
jgi:hypothetical protein